MNTLPFSPEHVTQNASYSTNILVKGLITGALILLMLIPLVFIANLISEREDRQKQVVAEVSEKWATSQTISGPYIIIPYNKTVINDEKKPVLVKKFITVLPEVISMKGKILPEKRLRSIYTVLLYRSLLSASGSFKILIPSELNPADLLFNEARICMGLTDFKGIEERVSISLKDQIHDLLPGVPVNVIDSVGLSAKANITSEDLGKDVTFNFQLKFKGSEKLHFIPLCGNGDFELTSPWTNPSFDGSTLPTERSVNDKGFTAKWKFNKANLPFTTVLEDVEINKRNYVFGLSMVQPADHYAKTMRSVKYGILFIGLTFSLFFITEIMQKRPVHPVQYVLIGLALIIFYSLLLALSEFILFNYAYLVASLATIILITLYAKGHFGRWKVAAVFTSILSSLYGFIFILIQLEDTALLAGSIGLFVILAIVMYISRKIDWYQATIKTAA